MKSYFGIAAAMLVGAAFGAVGVGGLHAQIKPGAYVVVDISEMTDPDTFKTLLPKAPAAAAAFAGQFIARTDKAIALDGTPPQRFVVIGFESVEKAKAFDASAAEQEVNAIRMKSTKSRSFIVEGM
jgi:uncharacterized protein (DUF1330 family)